MPEIPEPAPQPEVPAPSHPLHFLFLGPNGLRAGWGLLLFVLFFYVTTFAFRFLLAHVSPPPSPAHQASPASILLGEGALFASVLVATFLVARIERRSFLSFGLGGTRRLPLFLQGLFWGVLCLSLLLGILRLGGFLSFDALLLRLPSALAYGLVWLAGFTLVAFFEETLLRGYLQITLARGISAIYARLSPSPRTRYFGFWTAALLLSFLFGLGHRSNPGESPIGLFAAGIAGLVFCLSLYRTGSLWWALGFHAAWDWAQSFLYGVSDSGILIQGRLLATHPVGRPILSGGLTGPEGSLLVLPVLALVSIIILVTLPRTPLPAMAPSDPQ